MHLLAMKSNPEELMGQAVHACSENIHCTVADDLLHVQHPVHQCLSDGVADSAVVRLRSRTDRKSKPCRLHRTVLTHTEGGHRRRYHKLLNFSRLRWQDLNPWCYSCF